MFSFIRKSIARVQLTEARAAAGLRGRLTSLRDVIESDIAKAHAAIETVESGLRADIKTVESEIVGEAARLHGMIHGKSA